MANHASKQDMSFLAMSLCWDLSLTVEPMSI